MFKFVGILCNIFLREATIEVKVEESINNHQIISFLFERNTHPFTHHILGK